MQTDGTYCLYKANGDKHKNLNNRCEASRLCLSFTKYSLTS